MKILFATTSIFIFCVVLSETSVADAARMNSHRAEKVVKNGGLIEAPLTGNIIRIVNQQHSVRKEFIIESIKYFEESVGLAVDLMETPVEDGKSAVTIDLVELNNGPTILIAPEDKWGQINVARLTSDSPRPVLLETRVRKELWRVLAMVLGAANSNFKPSVMHNVFSLSDLDADPAYVVCPECLDKIQRTGHAIGITRRRFVSYKKACQEGWAPAPTNDVQKAIWDKVHAMPKNPMKIEFDPKKGR